MLIKALSTDLEAFKWIIERKSKIQKSGIPSIFICQSIDGWVDIYSANIWVPTMCQSSRPSLILNNVCIYEYLCIWLNKSRINKGVMIHGRVVREQYKN